MSSNCDVLGAYGELRKEQPCQGSISSNKALAGGWGLVQPVKDPGYVATGASHVSISGQGFVFVLDYKALTSEVQWEISQWALKRWAHRKGYIKTRWKKKKKGDIFPQMAK